MSESPKKPERSVNQNLLAGSAWSLLMRWVMRGIGLVSILFLARLLTPRDFGIVAMASLVIGLIDSFTEVGVQFLLMRQRDATPEHCNTAWTIRLIQSLIVTVMIVAAAPLAAIYFTEPQLTVVMYVLALSMLISGFSNIGLVLIRKNLDFARDFRFSVYSRLAGFVVTLGLTVTLRTYWALVIGQVVGGVLSVVLSYGMHPYRPRLSLAHWRDYLSFSVSVVLSNIAKFLRNKVDVLIVGGMADTAQLGAYNVASELASMAVREISSPVWRGLFPTFARLVGKPDEFSLAFRRMLSALVMICVPLGLGVMVVAEDAIAVVLGDQWSTAVPLLQWLAVYATVMALMEALSNNILFVTGHEKSAVKIMWLHIAVLFPACLMAGRVGGTQAVAMAAAISSVAVFPVAVIAVCRLLPVTLAQLLGIAWRPAAAVTMMILTVTALHDTTTHVALYRLLVDVGTGAVVYGAVVIGLWVAAGRPDGVERIGWMLIKDKLGARF